MEMWESMKYLLIVILCITAIIAVKKLFFSYDNCGFNRKGKHKNGTRYDEFGFDIQGFDKNGYNRDGYDRHGFDKYGFDKDGYNESGFDKTGFNKFGYNSQGYDKAGFNKSGYNYLGKNKKGQYNRLYDADAYDVGIYSKDGFLNPHIYKIAVTNHACERISERIRPICGITAEELAHNAYCFGKSSRQIKRTSAALVEEIENRYDDGIVLIYKGYIYVFSRENVLITVYKNEHIPL